MLVGGDGALRRGGAAGRSGRVVARGSRRSDRRWGVHHLARRVECRVRERTGTEQPWRERRGREPLSPPGFGAKSGPTPPRRVAADERRACRRGRVEQSVRGAGSHALVGIHGDCGARGTGHSARAILEAERAAGRSDSAPWDRQGGSASLVPVCAFCCSPAKVESVRRQLLLELRRSPLEPGRGP